MFIILNGSARKTGTEYEAIYVFDNGAIFMYGDYVPDNLRRCPEIDAHGKNCASRIFGGFMVYKRFITHAQKMQKQMTVK